MPVEDSQIIGWLETTKPLFGATADKSSKKMRPRFYGEMLPRVEESRYPGWANLSYISVKTVTIRLHEKQKNLTRLWWWGYPPNQTTFSPYNGFAILVFLYFQEHVTGA